MNESNPFPILDGHNDTILALERSPPEQERTFFNRTELGHIDLPRAREGGLAGGFFAVFTPNTDWEKQKIPRIAEGAEGAPDSGAAGPAGAGRGGDIVGWDVPHPNPIDRGYALDFTVKLLSRLIRLEADSDGEVRVVRRVEELERCIADGTLAVILHVEGAECIDTDLEVLHLLYEAGLRSLGPVWSRSNDFGHGVPFSFPGSPDVMPGLTDAGKRLVRSCNELGILIDLSHLNEKGFWDVAEQSSAPLVATHSCAHALCPSPRNLTDRQIDALGETNGIVGINFARSFLRSDGDGDADTPVTEIVRHAAYVAERIGVEHVALGSDFDGTQVPQDLKDAAGLPKLVDALTDHGFDEDSLKKVTHQNWIRVLDATWRG